MDNTLNNLQLHTPQNNPKLGTYGTADPYGTPGHGSTTNHNESGRRRESKDNLRPLRQTRLPYIPTNQRQIPAPSRPIIVKPQLPAGKICKPNSSISVTQINLHKAKHTWHTLVANIVGDTSPLILATEPYADTTNTIPPVHSDLSLFYYREGDKKPRAAIAIHNRLLEKGWELTQFTTPDLVAMKLRLDKGEIVVVSCYMDGRPEMAVPPNDLRPVVDFARTNNLPLVIGSDTNAHHFAWGNRYSDSRGDDLLEYMDGNNLSWSNRGTTPTFVNSRGHNSIIDLTITNDKGSDLVCNWKVGLDESSSDHRYIRFNIGTEQTTKKKIRLTKNTDWGKLDEILTHSEKLRNLTHRNLETRKDLDKAATELNNILGDAFEKACPITYISNSVKKPPWLTPEVEQAKRTMRHHLMKARPVKGKNKPEWLVYREKVKAYNKLIKTTKRKEWREFCRNAESVRGAARMNKILKSCSSTKEKLEVVYKTKHPKDKNKHVLTKSPEETLETMSNTHFGDPGPDKHMPPSNRDSSYSADPILLDTIYHPERLTKAVNTFDPHKAAGPDGFQPLLIQKTWDHISEITRKIMRTSHMLQHTPVPWRESKGLFLAKPGKTDYRDTKSYRTITLSPVLLKIHEKVILWHMDYDLKMTSMTSDRQFGFKKGSSTETALHKVVRCIEKWVAKRGFVLGTFLDVEGAFDNVSFDAISQSIHNSPVDKSTAGWIANMVSNRYITVTHKTHTKRIRITRGCPQGGILSPFLWNLVVDDLLSFTADKLPGYLQAFADDLVGLAEGQDLECICERTQKTINTIETWCKSKGLNISNLKTKVVMFTWRKKWTLPKAIVVEGKPVELSESAKFLGVTLDSKLNFNEHIRNITKKATMILMQCKKAVGPTWGMTPKTCRWIYTSVVRPVLSYASVVWVNALNTQINTKQLEKVQRLALNIMTGALPGTSNINLNHLTDTPNIVTYLKGEAAKGAARLMAYKDWTGERHTLQRGTIRRHSSLNNRFVGTLALPTLNLDLTKPVTNLDQNFATVIPRRDEVADLITKFPEEAITCYTDGSKTENGTGYGFVITTKNNENELHSYSAKLPDYCTVYQAELYAMEAAASWLSDYKGHDIIVLTDSLSGLQSLTKLTINNKSVTDCHRAISELARHNTVTVMWVAGHEGHWGNEKADELAKIGTESEEVCKGHLPQSFIKHSINMKVKELEAETWDRKGPYHSKRALDNKKHHVENIKKLLNSRNNYRIAIQLITGQAGLNYHLYKIHQANTRTCPKCEMEDETVEHFLGRCPFYAATRYEVFEEFYSSMTRIFGNYTIQQIVKYANLTGRLKYDSTKGGDEGVT
jgi:ribonuclease HI